MRTWCRPWCRPRAAGLTGVRNALLAVATQNLEAGVGDPELWTDLEETYAPSSGATETVSAQRPAALLSPLTTQYRRP